MAADSLFLALNERAANSSEDDLIFPLIQGILTFDTPYNGLARSMFVYGAFSNYQKVNSVFNVMTALSAAAPAGLARLSARRAATSSVAATGSPQWKTWQLVAVKTGTVGAIAAGGVAAYMNREAIMKGMRSVKNINKESVVEGYRSSMDALGQGLAYINRGNVGKSFAWLSDHFTFVGALLRQKELNRRLERMGALKGIGIHDFYCSLGENGYWSGGYFVPERTFCAVPESHSAYPVFERCVMPRAGDEIEAHLNMFKPEKHRGYEEMTDKSAELVKEWFLSEENVVDDPQFRETPPEEVAEEKTAQEILEKGPSQEEEDGKATDGEEKAKENELPDESPIDIAAAASLVPLPDDEGDLIGDASPENADTQEKRNYLNYLFGVAQQAGTGISDVKGWLPSKMPHMPSMPSMPAMPKVPAAVSSLGNVSMPSVNIFSKKGEETQQTEKESQEAEKKENVGGETVGKEEAQEVAPEKEAGEKELKSS